MGDMSEDIVQEMYLKLHRYIDKGTLKPETVNTYVYMIIRSLCLDVKKQQKRIIKVELPPNLIDTNEDHNEKAFNCIIDKLDKEIESWHWFDKMMFKSIYIDLDKSMRDIETDTEISLSTIFQTIKRCKQRSKETIGEDFEDYLNKEYERIN
jgi:DNA-directed RNA polymerase specialized sigma24 family protein